jgi:hypothetical protein
MSSDDLVFYTSENGDQWVLVGGTVGTTVRHQPRLSPGNSRDIPLEEFLPREQNTPQGQALKKLLVEYGQL